MHGLTASCYPGLQRKMTLFPQAALPIRHRRTQPMENVFPRTGRSAISHARARTGGCCTTAARRLRQVPACLRPGWRCLLLTALACKLLPAAIRPQWYEYLEKNSGIPQPVATGRKYFPDAWTVVVPGDEESTAAEMKHEARSLRETALRFWGGFCLIFRLSRRTFSADFPCIPPRDGVRRSAERA